MYILHCVDETYYTGSTWDLNRRILQHNSGEGSNYTAKRLPVRLVYAEYYDSISTAFKREKQIQGWSHAKKNALINRNTDELHQYSECRNESHYKRNQN